MANIEKTYEFQASLKDTFHGITSYDNYINHIEGIHKIERLPPKLRESTCQVRYDIQMIKTFYYILDMFEEKDCKIWWTMSDSNLMKKNEGSWVLSSLNAKKTSALYSLNVEFSGFIPSSVTKKLAETSLPRMFLGMQTIIDEVRKTKK